MSAEGLASRRCLAASRSLHFVLQLREIAPSLDPELVVDVGILLTDSPVPGPLWAAFDAMREYATELLAGGHQALADEARDVAWECALAAMRRSREASPV